MKIKGMKRVMAATVCGLVLGAAPVFAQDNQAAAPAPQDQPMHHGEGRGNMEEHRIEHMTKALNLTPDQVSQVKAIDQTSHEQMRAVHEDTSTQPADKHAKMTAIREDSMTKVRAVLNDEQRSKFDAMQAKMKEHREDRRGEQGPPPAQ